MRDFIATILMENLKGNQEAAAGSEPVEPQRFQNQVKHNFKQTSAF